MKNNKKGGMSAGKVMAIGAGVAALAAASYYFFGPEGKKNQKKMKGWMIKMKGEIVEKMEGAKEVTEAAYHKIVDTVASKYLKGASAAEAKMYVDMLKKQWKGIAASFAQKKKTAKKAVKKAVKTGTKKAGQKKSTATKK